MTTNNENSPELKPIPWRRPRICARANGVFSHTMHLIFAAATWWANVPKASITRLPGNAYQPPALGDAFKKGALAEAKVVLKFKDRRDVPYLYLNRGTIVRAEEKVESKTRRHRNEVAQRPANYRNVRHTLDAASMAQAAASLV
jgi:hypothetical protein